MTEEKRPGALVSAQAGELVFRKMFPNTALPLASQPESMTHRVIVALARKPDGAPRYSQRGPLYAARVEGEEILSGSIEPFFEACRILKARGLSGPVELWDEIRPFPRMRSTIEAAAWLTVEEGDGRPRFRRWRPNPRASVGGEAVDGEIALPGTPAALDAMAAILSGAAHDR